MEVEKGGLLLLNVDSLFVVRHRREGALIALREEHGCSGVDRIVIGLVLCMGGDRLLGVLERCDERLFPGALQRFIPILNGGGFLFEVLPFHRQISKLWGLLAGLHGIL